MKSKTKITYPRFLLFGESAITVEFGDTIDIKTNRRVVALYNSLLKTKPGGLRELVPTYRSLLARYDPQETDYEKLVALMRELDKTDRNEPKAQLIKTVEIPVIYGGNYGPDIETVANYNGLTEEEVVAYHSEKEYRVYMIGFLAGFPYLGKVVDDIATPRHQTPRLKVPAGSVGIAEQQTGIYPCEAPGGWQIIGRTPLRLFDPLEQPPALLRPGDTVRFQPVSETQYQKLHTEEQSRSKH